MLTNKYVRFTTLILAVTLCSTLLPTTAIHATTDNYMSSDVQKTTTSSTGVFQFTPNIHYFINPDQSAQITDFTTGMTLDLPRFAKDKTGIPITLSYFEMQNRLYVRATPLTRNIWKCAAGISGGGILGGTTGGLSGAAVGTITLPLIGTVSGALVGGIGGLIGGALSGATACF